MVGLTGGAKIYTIGSAVLTVPDQACDAHTHTHTQRHRAMAIARPLYCVVRVKISVSESAKDINFSVQIYMVNCKYILFQSDDG